jgi:NAD(P)-dependent dehydrogenase (short-subunit alcohol dehydrogenase family)
VSVRFDGKVVIVTGAGGGIGREHARLFASEGASVVVNDTGRRTGADAASVAAEIQAEGGRAVADTTSATWDGAAAIVEHALDAFGRVDVLVNNAGMSPLYGSLGEIDQALWDKVLAVNLRGPFRLAVLIGERMAAAGGGAIVNVSSASARHPTPDVIPYAAAKAGLEAVTVALAHGLGPSVRVNAVAPGTFFTDVSAHWDMEEFGRRAERFALRRGGEPEEIVGAVLYLAGDGARYTTGAVLPVDGGFA